MLTTEEYPSFGHWYAQGATSLWEDFEGKQSRLHHMYASPMDFILPYIGGIHNEGVGFSRVRFSPYLYSESCSGHYSLSTVRGTLLFDWQYKDGRFTATLKKPKSVEATLSIFGEELKIEEEKMRIERVKK